MSLTFPFNLLLMIESYQKSDEIYPSDLMPQSKLSQKPVFLVVPPKSDVRYSKLSTFPFLEVIPRPILNVWLKVFMVSSEVALHYHYPCKARKTYQYMLCRMELDVLLYVPLNLILQVK